jgi:hypothetical protein
MPARQIRGSLAGTLADATLVATALKPDFSDDEIQAFRAFCGEIEFGTNVRVKTRVKDRAAATQEFSEEDIEAALLALMMMAA